MLSLALVSNHSRDKGESMVFDSITYCIRCCMPETQEGQIFDEFGYCNVCRSSEEKMKIDWGTRRLQLEQILRKAQDEYRDKPYDCIIPISGGKDSVFQLHILVKEYGMRPLAVTFSHNWFSSTGFYNLMNCLERFDVDHIMFTPKRSQVNKLAKKSLSTIGDGVGSFPLKIAKDFGIKLIVWGESVAESSSRGTYAKPLMKFDQDYFLKVSAKVQPNKMTSAELPIQELEIYRTPNSAEYAEAQISGIHLGDYIFWDEERQTEFIKQEYGWKETHVEGTYKRYKSAECIMPGVHDFANYLKRGYGRASFHASADVRAGIINREEAFEKLTPLDSVVPKALEYYSEITGINLEKFIETVSKQKHPALQDQNIPITKNTMEYKPPRLFIDDLRDWVSNEE
jgi:N-acetyl sugar amidotransferase